MHYIYIYIYINNILYTVSTATCFSASALSSETLNLGFAKITALLKLQLNIINLCKQPTWRTVLFRVCLFLFSICFGQPCAHHQENWLYQYDIWYMPLCIDGVQVWMRLRLIQTCTPNGHLCRVTYIYTRCRIDTINSPDDGHMVARNM